MGYNAPWRWTYAKTDVIEYQTVIVGAAYLAKGILRRLGFVSAIDDALLHQPVIETTYGRLAQVIVVNRLTFQPVPLYGLAAWAAEDRMDHVFGIQAAWLDDDRLGAMLEAVADHQVTIWSTVLRNAVKRFGVNLKQLHSDTTSVYFEGAHTDEQGQPLGGEERVPMRRASTRRCAKSRPTSTSPTRWMGQI